MNSAKIDMHTSYLRCRNHSAAVHRSSCRTSKSSSSSSSSFAFSYFRPSCIEPIRFFRSKIQNSIQPIRPLQLSSSNIAAVAFEPQNPLPLPHPPLPSHTSGPGALSQSDSLGQNYKTQFNHSELSILMIS